MYGKYKQNIKLYSELVAPFYTPLHQEFKLFHKHEYIDNASIFSLVIKLRLEGML